MPTPHRALAAVARALAGVNPEDTEAVTMFYRRQFTAYAPPLRALISDFLIGLTDMPSEEDLKALKQVVAGPLEDVPELSAPIWDERYGAAMTYERPEKVDGINYESVLVASTQHYGHG